MRFPIPAAHPCVEEEELQAVAKVFQAGWMGLGETVSQFEERITEFIGTRYTVATSSCTAALHLVLLSLGVGPEDEVLMPSLTFVASAQAAIACGARVVFCEVDKDTLNIDLNDAEDRITSRTKVILATHYGGQPCNIGKLRKIGEKHGIAVVEDAAHAFGSMYWNHRIGHDSIACCFSFDPIKVVTCGEGGVVCTTSPEMAKQLRQYRNLGIDRNSWDCLSQSKDYRYDVVGIGFRYHMSNINAAIGLIQLKKYEQFARRRVEICLSYDAGFKGCKEIRTLRRQYDSITPFNYVIRIPAGKRSEFLTYLTRSGIGYTINYPPIHLFSLFKGRHPSLPVTERVGAEIISLPLFPTMTNKELEYIIDTVLRFAKEKL